MTAATPPNIPAAIWRENHMRDPIFRAIYDASMAVEKCGGSVELTAAVTAVGAIREHAARILDELDAAAPKDTCACSEPLTNSIGRCSRCQKLVLAPTETPLRAAEGAGLADRLDAEARLLDSGLTGGETAELLTEAADALRAAPARSRPLPLLVDNEALKRQIESDPDDEPSAGGYPKCGTCGGLLFPDGECPSGPHAAPAREEAALRALLQAPVCYVGNEIRIICESHGDAIRMMREARVAIAASGGAE